MQNYYEILGVDQKASQDEIKRAYFKMIRKYSPEKDEKNFKRVREAYEVLSNSMTKGEYDQLMTISPMLRNNFLCAKKEIEQGQFSSAITRLKEMLNYQDSDLIRVLLADAYLLNNNSGNAIKLYEALVNQYPTHVIFKSKLGNAYMTRGWHKKAIPILEETVNVDKEDIGNWLGLARAYNKAGWLEEAVSTLEKAMQQDFELANQSILFFSKWQNQILLCDRQGGNLDIEQDIVQEITQHIAKIKAETESNDQERYVMADMLLYIGQNAAHLNCRQVAKVCVNSVQKIIYVDEDMKETIDYINFAINTGNEVNEIIRDDEVHREFMKVIKCYLFPRKILEISKEEYEFERRLAVTEMAIGYKKFASQIQLLKTKYPKLYAQAKTFFEKIETPSQRKKILKDQANNPRLMKRLMSYGMGEPMAFDGIDEEDYFDMSKQEPVRKQKIGRNDPCPCGSGKKYKQCCGRN